MSILQFIYLQSVAFAINIFIYAIMTLSDVDRYHIWMTIMAVVWGITIGISRESLPFWQKLSK